MLFEKNREIFRLRLKKLLKDNNLTQKQFAEEMEVSQPIVSNWLDGSKMPYYDKVQKMSQLFNVDIPYLMGEDYLNFKGQSGYRLDDEIYTREGIDFIRIPLYSSISCGTGIFVDDNIEDYIVVPDRYIQRNKEYFANIARGDSMVGKGIKNNDVLVFEKTTFIENGEVGAFCIDESEAVCKIFRKLSSGIVLLESANPNYDPIEIDIMNNCFKVVGKYKFKFSIEQE